MKNLKKVLAVGAKYLVIILISGLLGSCNSQKNCPLCPASPTVNPDFNFKIIDKTTNEDLFFGSSAMYDLNQIKFKHLINGKPDTTYLRIDTLNHSFNLDVPTIHSVDTVTMQITNLPTDILLFNTETPGKCCPITTLVSILFNGVVVYNKSDGDKIALLKQ
jgi:hypothetical protein